jgi:TRAP-type C4-dicarboxylate transport system permease small subunit
MKKIIEKIKTKIKNFLKDDFNNWYVRLCCLCFSIALIISSFVTIIEIWFVSVKHLDIVYGHPWKWLLISVIVIIIAGLQMWFSKLFYKLYHKIKTYQNV